ncbi:Golgi transport complex subunit 5-domain-containing protein [Chytridium lagenaria]|nr:Golgi transport complex subunit 5-domain-containing protein [Chytridium lagenaria]
MMLSVTTAREIGSASPDHTDPGVDPDTRRPSMTASIHTMLQHADYRDFCSDGFDASDYANMIIQAPQTAISKLSFNIEHLNKQLHDQVTTHYEDLLQQVTGLSQLEQAVVRVKDGVQSLNTSFERVKIKIEENHDQFRSNSVQLTRAQEAADVLRRLEIQSPQDSRELSKAALSLCEIDEILAESDLSGIQVVEVQLPKVKKTRTAVISQAEKQIQEGLKTQTQPEIASGLQVFYNLNQLSEKTKDILDRILDTLIQNVRSALDASILSKEIQESNAALERSRKENGPGPVTLYAAGLWRRMEDFMDVLYENTLKVYLLERVLVRMRDPLAQTTFLDLVVKVIDGGIIQYYWKTLLHSFEKELKLATKASTFLLQIFQVGYPKLLRFFHDFFSRLAVYVKSHTSKDAPVAPSFLASTASLKSPVTPVGKQPPLGSSAEQWHHIPDALALLKPLRPFETAYLQDSYSRLLEPVNNAFPDKPVVGARPLPSRDDVDKVLRTVSRELDVAKFDEGLLRAVVKRVAQTLNMYAIRTEHSAATDASAYQVTGAGTATSSQLLNLEIVNCLWSLGDGVYQIGGEFKQNAHVVTVILESIGAIIEPLMIHITREIETTILKIHKEDYANTFILEVGMKLRWISRELLSRLQCGDDLKTWVSLVAARILEFFLRHASLARPLSETGKLKLTSDMTQLEFALNQWVSVAGLSLEGVSFRQLLFLDLTQVTAIHHTSSLPPLIISHHLIVRCHPSIPLPTSAFNWTEAQYSEWLDSRNDVEGAGLLSRCLDAYVEEVRRRGEKEFRVEYPVLRTVLGGVKKVEGG